MPPTLIAGERVECLLRSSYELGEGALWSPTLNAYLHVDILGTGNANGPAFYVHDVYGSGAVTAYPTPSACGTVVVVAGGKQALVTLRDGPALVDLDSKAVKHVCDPEGVPTNRWNDGKCAPEGRFWGGTMGSPVILTGAGALYRLEGDLTAHKALGGVTVSNGLVWSPDGATMFYIDTPRQAVLAFDYDPATGAITNEREAFKPRYRNPDGCAMDAAGRLWIAHWEESRVACYNVATGEVEVEVHLPCSLVTSCAFGGASLEDLYITTAKEVLTQEQRAGEPHAGDVFIVRGVGARGLPQAEFALKA